MSECYRCVGRVVRFTKHRSHQFRRLTAKDAPGGRSKPEPAFVGKKGKHSNLATYAPHPSFPREQAKDSGQWHQPSPPADASLFLGQENCDLCPTCSVPYWNFQAFLRLAKAGRYAEAEALQAKTACLNRPGQETWTSES
eukprot:1159895-Pelagomonas_calceolata.AAC.9